MARSAVRVIAMTWKMLAERTVSGSPSSGEWREYLCVGEVHEGFEIAICGYELDENGNESDELIADPSYEAVVIPDFTLSHLPAALAALDWRYSDLTVLLARGR